MNWYSLFYWVSVADSVKHFFDWWSDFFTTFTVLSLILYAIMIVCKALQVGSEDLAKGKEEEDSSYRALDLVGKKSFVIFRLCLILALVTWAFYVLIPTKKDFLIILAGGAVGSYIAGDSSIKALPHEATELLREGIKSEIRHIRADTVISSTVDTASSITKQVKDSLMALPKEQLVQFIQEVKSTHKNIVSNDNIK